jgi:hypothetical protein
MSHKTQSRRRWALLPLTLALVFMVVAVPAAAKGPVFNAACPPSAGKVPVTTQNRALCQRSAAATDGKGMNGADAGILAGSVAVLVLLMAGGLLVATRRRDAQGRHAPAVSVMPPH